MKNHKMLILGRSGSGKSISMRNLDPKTTGIINCDKQDLMFPHAGYKTVMVDGKPDLTKSNYVETSKPSSVVTTLKIWNNSPHIKTIVIDTITHLITSYYITEALGKEFGGYKELGTSFWNILNTVRTMNKNIIVFGHLKTEFNDDGVKEVTMKSHGNMIKDFESESYFNILLLAEVIKEDDKLKYIFRTEPKSFAEKIKTPVMFNADGTLTRALAKHEPNDIQSILNKLDKFNN